VRALKPKATLVPVALLTFSRLIVDQTPHAMFDNVRLREIKFCEFIIREKFVDCMQLGRDLLLVLCKLSKLPEFESIWKDLALNPSKFASNFGGNYQNLNNLSNIFRNI
jgi:integrator complex subunit 3